MQPDDAQHMRAAIALAARGLGECWPNPSVGCVIVAEHRVIARARTAPTGRPHAETQALALAGTAAYGATAYVTLEPCAHTGKTPPCAQALIAAGIARVVIALTDPDPRTNGAGIAQLRAAGITVDTSICEAEAARVTEPFLRRIASNRPMVTLKLATSLDGRIATSTGQSQWITSPASRRAAHALRAEHDAILAGATTIAADNPSLDCRLQGARTRPLIRIVADSRLRTPASAQVIATAAQIPTWLLARSDADPARRAALEAAGAAIISCPATPDGIDLAAALHHLADHGLTSLLAEGGAAIAASLLRAGLVDRIAWFHAPSLIGADGLPAIQPFGMDTLPHIPPFHRTESHAVGPDMLTLLARAP